MAYKWNAALSVSLKALTAAWHSFLVSKMIFTIKLPCLRSSSGVVVMNASFYQNFIASLTQLKWWVCCYNLFYTCLTLQFYKVLGVVQIPLLPGAQVKLCCCKRSCKRNFRFMPRRSNSLIHQPFIPVYECIQARPHRASGRMGSSQAEATLPGLTACNDVNWGGSFPVDALDNITP